MALGSVLASALSTTSYQTYPYLGLGVGRPALTRSQRSALYSAVLGSPKGHAEHPEEHDAVVFGDAHLAYYGDDYEGRSIGRLWLTRGHFAEKEYYEAYGRPEPADDEEAWRADDALEEESNVTCAE